MPFTSDFQLNADEMSEKVKKKPIIIEPRRGLGGFDFTSVPVSQKKKATQNNVGKDNFIKDVTTQEEWEKVLESKNLLTVIEVSSQLASTETLSTRSLNPKNPYGKSSSFSPILCSTELLAYLSI